MSAASGDTVIQKVTEFPMDKDFQINPLLLDAAMQIKKIRLSLPILEEAEVAIVLTDRNGDPRKTKDGEFLYVKEIIRVFKGWEVKDVDLPIPEFASRALISSNLLEPEISLIRNIFADMAYLIVRMIKEGKDYSAYIAQLYVIMAGIVDPAKARNGELAKLMKTSISRGESKIEQIQQEISSQLDKQGLMDRFKK